MATRRWSITRRQALVAGLGTAAAVAGCSEASPIGAGDASGAEVGGGHVDAAPPDLGLAADAANPDAAAPDAVAPDAVAPDAVAPDADPADAGSACTLYPEQTEGPYYLDLAMLRRDVTEGRPGIPLVLVIEVLDTACAPIRDLAVDIWQADADGRYSGYPGQLGGVDTTGQTFLRGTQVTGADGRAEFLTIYPGWYPGRTTHIHFKVHRTANSEATSQLYFPEPITAAVYQLQPYAARGPKDTTNAADGVNQGNVPPLAVVSPEAGGYRAHLTVTLAG